MSSTDEVIKALRQHRLCWFRSCPLFAFRGLLEWFAADGTLAFAPQKVRCTKDPFRKSTTKMGKDLMESVL
jgi:hypothetical protein